MLVRRRTQRTYVIGLISFPPLGQSCPRVDTSQFTGSKARITHCVDNRTFLMRLLALDFARLRCGQYAFPCHTSCEPYLFVATFSLTRRPLNGLEGYRLTGSLN